MNQDASTSIEPNNKLSSRRNFLLGSTAVLGAVAATGCDSRQPLNANEIREWDITVDLVVTGSGGAGASAAIEALSRGDSVLILEEQPVAGGATAMSGGVCYLGGGTPLQKLLGFEDTVEEMYRYIVEAGPPHPHTEKVQIYCEQSIEHFRWLVKMGVEFSNSYTAEKGLPFEAHSLYYSGSERAWPWREKIRPAPRGHKPGVKDHGGWKLMETLLGQVDKLGGQLMLSTAGSRIILNNDGRVHGIAATQSFPGSNTRKELMIRARKAVVLSCGGFVQNREMVRLYAPELADISTPWGSAGDLGSGILMGLGAGGTAIRMNQALITIPLYPPEKTLRGILVNRSGQRFIAEDNYHCFVGNAAAIHQQGTVWLLTDQQSVIDSPDHRVSVAGRSQTLQELENLGNFPEGALRHTISYYNYHARRKRDPLLHKSPELLVALDQPPFTLYAINVNSTFTPHLTFGGLHTDIHSRVISSGGEPIPGLYAAGRTASGLPGSPYVGSGISVGDATFFGRKAGIHATTVKA